MKVRGVGIKHNKINSVVNSEEKRTAVENKENFKNQLNDISKSNYSEMLTSLADQISKQGELICERCDLKEFKKYKELISVFLQEVVKYNFEFDKQSKFDNFGRFKVYANIKKINQNIEGLTQEFLKEQQDSIAILKMVEDIKGLILDMFL